MRGEQFSTTLTMGRLALELHGGELIAFVAITVWQFLCLLTVIVITSYSFYQLFWRDSSAWINSTYRNLTIMIMICFTFTIALLLFWILENYLYKQFDDVVMDIILVVKDTFYYCGNCMFYVLLLITIAVPFELNKCVKYSLGFVIFISSLTAIAYIAMIIIIHNKDYHIWRAVIAMLAASDLILNVFILIIFVRKIKITMANMNPLLSIKAQKNVNVMMNVVAKHCLLFGISIIINQGFTTTLFISTYLSHGGLYSFVGDVITTIAVAMECTTNVLVLWLILRINYDKYICFCLRCHLCIAKCCFKSVDEKAVVDNPYRELLLQRTT